MAIHINNTSRREELSQLSSLQREIDIALQDPNLDPALKQSIIDDLALTQSTIQADQMSNTDARRYTLGVYTGIKDKLNGGQGYSAAMVGGATKNMFGRYSRPETDWMANETLRRSGQHPTQSSSGTTYFPASSEQSRSAKIIHLFNPPTSEQSYEIAGAKKDKATSVKAFASYLTTQLTNARTILADPNNSLQGWDYANNSKIDTWLELLRSVGTGTDDDLNTQILKMGEIVNSIKNDAIKDEFENSFKSWLAGFDESEERVRAEEAATAASSVTIHGKTMSIQNHPNEAIQKIIRDNGWKAAYDKDSDSYYIIKTNADGTMSLVESDEYVELDPTKIGTYQHGLITDALGKMYFGDLTDQSFIDQIGQERFGQLATKIKQAHKNHWKIQDFSSMNLGIGVDFSDYLSDPSGERAIIFYDPRVPGSEDFPLWLDYDSIFKDHPDWIDRFKYNGYADVDTSGNSTDNQYIISQGGNTEFTMPTDVPELDSNYAYTYFSGNRDGNGDINNSRGGTDYTISTFFNVATPEDIIDRLKKHVAYNLLIYNGSTRSDWAKEQIRQLTGGKAFEEVEVDGQKIKVGSLLIKQLATDGHMAPILVSIIKTTDDPEVRQRAIQELQKIQDAKPKVQVGQDGMEVVYAKNNPQVVTDPMKALGVNTGIAPSDAALMRLKPGFSGYNSNKNRTRTFTDDEKAALRWMLTSAALDLSSMFTGGYVAGALGLGSMVSDIVADTKMGLPTRNIVGNASTNLGWALLGMAPLVGNAAKSAKVAKIGTQIGKWATRLGVGYGAIAELLGAPETASIIEKWCTAPNTMTVEDYRMLASTLRSVTGMASAGKGHRTLRKTDVVDIDPKKHVVVTDQDGNVTTKAVSEADFDEMTSSNKFWPWKRIADKKQKTQAKLGEGVTAHRTPTMSYGLHTSDLHTVNQQAAIDRALWVTQKQKTGATTWVGQKWQGFRNAGLPEPTVPYKSQEQPDIYWFQTKGRRPAATATTSTATSNKGKQVKFTDVKTHKVNDNVSYTIFKVNQADFNQVKTGGVENVLKKNAEALPNPEAFGLPAGAQAVYDPVKKVVVYTDPTLALPAPSTNKSGGKLKRLNAYISK